MRLLVLCLLLANDKLTVEDYLDWERVSDPQISPDGSQVLYTREWVDKENDTWASALWTVHIDGGKHRFLVKGSRARWSPAATI